jgi:hypothetical protein
LLSGHAAKSQDQDFERSETSIHLYPEENSKIDTELFTPRTHGQDSSLLFSNISRSGNKSSDAKNNDEEEALKFNFLYFIIQKFKISDIID